METIERSAFLQSAALHLVCVAVLVVSVRFSDIVQITPPVVEVIDAVMIQLPPSSLSAQPVLKPAPPIQPKIHKPVVPEPVKPKEVIKPKEVVKPKEAVKPKEQIDENALQLKKEQVKKETLEKQKIAEQKVQKEKQAKEQLEKQKIAQEKAAKEKKIQDQKQREAALRAEAENALQMQLKEERALSQAQSEMAEYYPLIIARIQQNWRRDLSAGSGVSCLIRVRIAGNGEVLDAVVLESSGDKAFDHSATIAVMRSSPLPLPESARAREELLRGFNFLFKPEDA